MRPSFASMWLWVIPARSAAARCRRMSPCPQLRRRFWDGAVAVDLRCCVQASAACITGVYHGWSPNGSRQRALEPRRRGRCLGHGVPPTPSGGHGAPPPPRHLRLCFGWDAPELQRCSSSRTLTGELPHVYKKPQNRYI
jgi:hypothetical protein